MKEKHGTCPSCEKENTFLVDSNYDDGVYTDEMECEDCGSKWKETFVYSKFELIKKA